MNKNVIQIIGAAAFVVGGLLARSKTLDGIETLEEKYMPKGKTSSDSPAE